MQEENECTEKKLESLNKELENIKKNQTKMNTITGNEKYTRRDQQ